LIVKSRQVQLSAKQTRAQFHQHSTYSFYARGAQKFKKDSQVISLFMLSGSTSVKAVRRTLMKLTAGVHVFQESILRSFKAGMSNSKHCAGRRRCFGAKKSCLRAALFSQISF